MSGLLGITCSGWNVGSHCQPAKIKNEHHAPITHDGRAGIEAHRSEQAADRLHNDDPEARRFDTGIPVAVCRSDGIDNKAELMVIDPDNHDRSARGAFIPLAQPEPAIHEDHGHQSVA